MKKIAGILVLLLVLGGCIVPPQATQDTVLKDEPLVVENSTVPEESQQKAVQETEPSTELEQDIRLTTEEKAELLREQQNRYAFSTLEVTSQNLYVEILYALTNYVEEMELSTIDTEEIDRVFQCVMLDHPEIFYADGYSFVKYTLGEEIKKITFTGTYSYDRQERAAREAMIEEVVTEIMAGVDPQASDYDKVKYVYESVINRTEYDRQAGDNQNICSVFLNGRSVCQGYAKAAQYLLGRMGIPAALVIGTVDNSEGHAWNLIKINNEYYYMDTTWGDASYIFQNDSQQVGQNVPEINYDYLCVTTEDLLRTHAISELIPLPICKSMEDNYYVRENAYFTEVNTQQLEELVNRYYEEGRETLTLKCSDKAVYDEMLKVLLEEQEIFQYLEPEGNSILYTDSARQMSITFWL